MGPNAIVLVEMGIRRVAGKCGRIYSTPLSVA
jgi:hypothetical protein